MSAKGKEEIVWLVDGGDLPHSFLDTIDPELKERIRCLRSGQARIDEFLRHVQGRIIPRDALVTVANQKDSMKRVRDARKALATEGLLVLGHQGNDPEIAKRRGFPPPKKGEVLVIPAEDA